VGLVGRIDVTPEQARTLRDEGALKLEKFLTAEGVGALREMVEAELRGAGGGEFQRARYDVGNRNAVTRSLLESAELRSMFRALIPRRLVFTQGIGFELTPGKAGLDWHFDFLSFSFFHPRDQGYTVWIPFERIDPAGQHGGLQVVPETVYSGRDKMLLSYRHVMRGPEVIERLGGRDAYRAQMPCSESERIVLDAAAVEPAFEPGDALVTDRFVWHRSVPLAPGPLRRRLAFILRFVDADARYDGTFCRRLGEFAVAFGNPNFSTAFGLSFTDLQDGDRMGGSRFAVPLGP